MRLTTSGQRSFDELGGALVDTTFCVIDFETTGASANECAITEIGAVKLRGGECLGTFQTLVNPATSIPPKITVLTGITETMVATAPYIDAVLGSFLEFIGDAVIVAHNVRFDMAFLQAAVEASGRDRLGNPTVDTVALSRRLLGGEVPNHRLGTLASRLRLDHTPTHRALDDALATGELLHVLLERAGSLGVTGLDDLIALPTMAGHEQASKLALTDGLPRRPGVYFFRDRRGDVLYVGKATNLRSRVRSYFSSDTRRKVGQLLRETARIDHLECSSPLEAAVVELRLIQRHKPRFNSQGTRTSRYAYVKLTLNERFPRLSVVKAARDDGCVYLGPFTSNRAARVVVDAVESVVPIRRCSARPSPSKPTTPCAPAQLGVAVCPCSGSIGQLDYHRIVQRVVRGITVDHDELLGPLEDRMSRLAIAERFEEAADARERADALARALDRQRRFSALRRAGTVKVTVRGHGGAEIRNGELVRTWRTGETPELSPPLPIEPEQPITLDLSDDAAVLSVVEPGQADELHCVATWFDREAHRLELLHCDGDLSEPVVPIPRFVARESA